LPTREKRREQYCKTFETRIISIHQQYPSFHEDKLVEDMIALVTSFAGKLHRQRGGKAPSNKKITGFK